MLYGVIPPGGGGVLNKVFYVYWEAPSRGETPNRPPNPSIYHFWQKTRYIIPQITEAE